MRNAMPIFFDTRCISPPADGDYVRGVTSTRALAVVGVDRPTLHGGKRVLAAPALIEGVSVDRDLDVLLISEGKTVVNGGGGSSPVLVQFQAAGSGQSNVVQALPLGRVTLPSKSKVEGEAAARGSESRGYIC